MRRFERKMCSTAILHIQPFGILHIQVIRHNGGRLPAVAPFPELSKNTILRALGTCVGLWADDSVAHGIDVIAVRGGRQAKSAG